MADGNAPEPQLVLSFAEVAAASKRDRNTVRQWADETPSVQTQRGRVVISGDTAVMLVAELDPSVGILSAGEAIAWLTARFEARKANPEPRPVPEPVRRIAEPTPRVLFHHGEQLEDPRYPVIGTGDPTVDEIAALLTSPDKPQKNRAKMATRVRRLLADYGLLVPERGHIPRDWLASDAGQAFYWTAFGTKRRRRRR